MVIFIDDTGTNKGQKVRGDAQHHRFLGKTTTANPVAFIGFWVFWVKPALFSKKTKLERFSSF